MRVLSIIVACVGLTACKKDAPAPTSAPVTATTSPEAASERTFSIRFTADQKPDDTIEVSMTIPSDVPTQVDKMGAPSFAWPGLSGIFPPALVSLRCPEKKDTASCVEWAIGLQYDAEDAAKATREPLSEGRVWMKHVRADGYVHARLFVPAPTKRGVLMCFMILKPQDAPKVDAIRAMCETMRVK